MWCDVPGSIRSPGYCQLYFLLEPSDKDILFFKDQPHILDRTVRQNLSVRHWVQILRGWHTHTYLILAKWFTSLDCLSDSTQWTFFPQTMDELDVDHPCDRCVPVGKGDSIDERVPCATDFKDFFVLPLTVCHLSPIVYFRRFAGIATWLKHFLTQSPSFIDHTNKNWTISLSVKNFIPSPKTYFCSIFKRSITS